MCQRIILEQFMNTNSDGFENQAQKKRRRKKKDDIVSGCQSFRIRSSHSQDVSYQCFPNGFEMSWDRNYLSTK